MNEKQSIKKDNRKETEPKQVIVMRKDLNMRKGKLIAQGSHASLGALLNKKRELVVYLLCRLVGIRLNKTPLQKWLTSRFTKVTLSCDSEKELIDLYTQAVKSGLNTVLITDAGFTEFNGVPTKTCIAIGPDYPEKINKITGHLKLL